MKVRFFLCLLAVMLLLGACSSQSKVANKPFTGAWMCSNIKDYDTEYGVELLQFSEEGQIELYSIDYETEYVACGLKAVGNYEIDGDQCIVRDDSSSTALQFNQRDENTITCDVDGTELVFRRISLDYPQELLGTWTNEERDFTQCANGDATMKSAKDEIPYHWFVMDGVLFMNPRFGADQIGSYFLYAYHYQVTGDRLVLTSLSGNDTEEFHR